MPGKSWKMREWGELGTALRDLIAVRACVCACVLSHVWLCSLMDCGPSGFSVHEIFQARILAWAAIYYSRASSRPSDQTHVSCSFCIGRWILNYCATWEAPLQQYKYWINYKHQLADVWLQDSKIKIFLLSFLTQKLAHISNEINKNRNFAIDDTVCTRESWWGNCLKKMEKDKATREGIWGASLTLPQPTSDFSCSSTLSWLWLASFLFLPWSFSDIVKAVWLLCS